VQTLVLARPSIIWLSEGRFRPAIVLLARTDDVTECYGREPRMPNVMPTGFPVRLRPELDPMYPMHRNEEYANDLDNPDPRRDLHRTRDQRLPAGRVLITTHSVETARRPQSRRASIFGAPADAF
jgi:hypothetical protein